eukprot:6205833-Pleurochrysis_carterae.AAC.2
MPSQLDVPCSRNGHRCAHKTVTDVLLDSAGTCGLYSSLGVCPSSSSCGILLLLQPRFDQFLWPPSSCA